MTSAPGSDGPWYVKLHWQFASVVHWPVVETEPETVKKTVTSVRGCSGTPPVTVAVTVCDVPTGLTAFAGLRTVMELKTTGCAWVQFENCDVFPNWSVFVAVTKSTACEPSVNETV